MKENKQNQPPIEKLHRVMNRYVELEKEHFIGVNEALLFAKLQMLFMGHRLKPSDASSFMRRAAALLDAISKEKLMVGSSIIWGRSWVLFSMSYPKKS